jgi:hypothetical protein
LAFVSFGSVADQLEYRPESAEPVATPIQKRVPPSQRQEPSSALSLAPIQKSATAAVVAVCLTQSFSRLESGTARFMPLAAQSLCASSQFRVVLHSM